MSGPQRGVCVGVVVTVDAGRISEERLHVDGSVVRLVATYPSRVSPRTVCCRPEQSWPEEGHITYEDVWMRYRPELDPVLKGEGGAGGRGFGVAWGMKETAALLRWHSSVPARQQLPWPALVPTSRCRRVVRCAAWRQDWHCGAHRQRQELAHRVPVQVCGLRGGRSIRALVGMQESALLLCQPMLQMSHS